MIRFLPPSLNSGVLAFALIVHAGYDGPAERPMVRPPFWVGGAAASADDELPDTIACAFPLELCGSFADSRPGNPLASLFAARSVDVSVRVTASPDPVAPGAKVTFKATVKNTGPDLARSVAVYDTLPVGTTFFSCSSTSPGVCGGSGNARSVSFSRLKVGKTFTITLVAVVHDTLASGTELFDTATAVSPVDPDTAQGNNSDTGRTTVFDGGRGFAGEWQGPFAWPLVAIHMSVLPDGRVLIWDATNPARIWNPTTDTFTTVTTPTTNGLFCSGHTFLADGRLFVAGGHITSSTAANGAPETYIFDPVNNGWIPGPLMNAGRWYPSTLALPNGEVVILSGNVTKTVFDKLPQVWQTNGTLRNLTGAQVKLPIYPRVHVAPDGRVFYDGPGPTSRYLDTAGTGSWTNGPAPAFGDRDYGTSVMYDEGKVLIVGGGGRVPGGALPTATAEVIDLHGGGGWRPVGSMAFPRRQLNATILADGKVLVTGGTSSTGFNNGTGSIFAAEIWDPQTEAWTTVGSMAIRRNYHATAVLLPDGRVVSAGGTASDVELPDGDVSHQDAEIYSPPYLFKANGSPAVRPVISSAPDAAGYNQALFVQTPDGPSITKVNLIRLSSVTHAFNESQSLNRLTFASAPGGLNVTMPATANLATPGPYLLFLVNGDGVPSVGHIVMLN